MMRGCPTRRFYVWGFEDAGGIETRLRRGHGHLHFLTFSCYRRLPLLRTARARKIFLTALEKIRERYGFLVVGYVVMPEHVHLLLREPARGTPSTVLKALKQRVSRDLRRRTRATPTSQLRLPFSAGADELPRFWQPRFHDFNVWSAKKRKEKLGYMHANPVKRGLVKNPVDWIWSSYRFYEKDEKGPVRIEPVD